MRPFFIFLISQTILLPLFIGLVRLRKLSAGYYPFLFLMIASFLSELVSFLLIRQHTSNAIPTNIYVLIEWLLIAWLFYNWGSIRQKKVYNILFIGIPVLIWIVENLVLGNITAFSPYFRLLYSFVIVLLSINTINYVIIHENSNIFRNARFLICLGFVIFFIYQIVYEWAYQVGKVQKTGITISITSLFSYVNATTNIIFAIAMALIPNREKFKL